MASQFIAITYINPSYDVSYNSSSGLALINKPVSDTSGWVIDTSGELNFSFSLKDETSIPSSETNIIKYIIFKSGINHNVNEINTINPDNIYTSGLLTTGEFNLQYNASNTPPSIQNIETIYSSFIKVRWSQYGDIPTSYRFTLVDATIPDPLINVYTYPDVPIGAITLESTNGQTKIYSYILPAPAFGIFTVSIGALFGTTLNPINEATASNSQIITGKSAVFSIGELLSYEREIPLVETEKARLGPSLHIIGNKNLRAHSDLVRLNTIEMQTEAIRQKVLKEPYNNINFKSYSDYISSKVGRTQRNFAL